MQSFCRIVIGVLSLRPIFVEIAKLIESHCTIQPNLHLTTIAEAKLGKFENLSFVSFFFSFAAVVFVDNEKFEIF